MLLPITLARSTGCDVKAVITFVTALVVLYTSLGLAPRPIGNMLHGLLSDRIKEVRDSVRGGMCHVDGWSCQKLQKLQMHCFCWAQHGALRRFVAFFS